MDIFDCRSCGREIVIILEPIPSPRRFSSATMIRKDKSLRFAAIHKDDLRDQRLAQRRHKMSYKVRANLEDKCRGQIERAENVAA
jgi:hypothetical protein